MVTKQAWRILTRPNSLVAKVYKAKYFPSSSILEAQISSNPSYIWRSIWSSLHLLREGVRRRVGSGENVRIWNEPWVPDLVNPFIQTPILEGMEAAKVRMLRVATSPTWDVETLQGLQEERDRNLILQLPLSTKVKEDSWTWRLDMKG